MTLYHINSHQCKVIKQKLLENDLSFEEIIDIPTILEKGVVQVPTLEVDGNRMEYFEILKWFKRWRNDGY